MHELFDICVVILYWIADVTGLTYKQANIWIFVIIHPIITLVLFIIVVRQRKKIMANNKSKKSA
jgi:hypothetical protein